MNYRYIFSGTLPEDAPTYIKRKADEELYQQLKVKQFCYVFNSRKMGKSSLRVRVMRRLAAEGYACAAIDLSLNEVQLATPNQWYFGIVDNLVENFKLDIELDDWWDAQPSLSPLAKLRQFIETILLRQISQNIVIFIDEIDSVLSLNFPTDDFFVFIRGCYNLRVDNPAFNRFSICLLGVATPSTLIKDKQRTPFNIGQRIELTGFTLQEALPLTIGLQGKVVEPKQILTAILSWTGGQPFLTQKLCYLVAHHALNDQLNIQELIQTQIINNWEYQDEPEHLKTIRDRLIYSDEKLRGRILGLHQQLLAQKPVKIDASTEQIELRLSGLVTPDKNQLKIANPIYALIFNRDWLESELAKLRPYAESFNAWAASNEQDQSRLLRGQALQETLAWSVDRSLSDRDYQFIAASQDLDNHEAKTALKAQKKANQILTKARTRAVWLSGGAIAAFVSSVIISIFIINRANYQAEQKITVAEIKVTIEASKGAFRSKQTFTALLEALRAVQKLHELERADWQKNDLQSQVITSLFQSVYNVREKNTIELEDDVNFLALDDQTIAYASKNSIKLVDRRTGKVIATLNVSKPSSEIDISPDGKVIATISEAKRVIQLWRRDGRLLKTIPENSGKVSQIKFSPDGQAIVAVVAQGDSVIAGRQNTVKLWKRDGTLVKTFDALYPDVNFSPDGKTLAIEFGSRTSYRERVTQVWKLDGTLLKILSQANYSNSKLQFEPGINWNRPRMIKTKETNTDLEFSPDGQIIASAGSNNFDGTLRTWDRNGGHILAGHQDVITDFTFSPDSQTIATASRDRKVRLWQPNGTLLGIIQHQGGVDSVDFSPDSQMIASAGEDKTIKIWRRDGTLDTSLIGHQEPVNGVYFSPNGQITSVSEDKTVKLWQWQGISQSTLTGHNGRVLNVSFSNDSQTIATSSNDDTVKLWQRDGTLIKTLTIGGSNPLQSPSVSFSPDSQIIATLPALVDRTGGGLKLWKQDGILLKTFPKLFGVVSFSPDGQIIATADYYQETVKLWQRDGTLFKTLKGHNEGVNSINFSPDGKIIAAASDDGTVKLWQRNGDLLKTLKGHSEGVSSMSFNPDGQIIATASNDGTVKLWQRNGNLLRTFIADNQGVDSVSFSPDGQMLATAGGNGTARLWTRNGGLLTEYDTSEQTVFTIFRDKKIPVKNVVNSVNFSPDGQMLAMAKNDGTVQLFEINLDRLTRLGCNWIQDYLITHPDSQQELTICQN
jgi:WD40 repeat protein